MKTLKRPRYSTKLLMVTITLCVLGLLTLFSASLGSLDNGESFYLTLTTQTIGLLLGGICIYSAIYIKAIDYRKLYQKNYALYFFLITLVVQLLVFTPFGISKNGAHRWLDLGITSIQPSELLKIGAVFMLGVLLIRFKKEIISFKYSAGISFFILGTFAVLMFAIRDKGTLLISCIALFTMLFISRIQLKHLILIVASIVIPVALYVSLAPGEAYVRERFATYLNLIDAPQDQGLQVDQSTMTIGSGMITGKGFGESIQKYQYLPEPLTDSIFAIYAEEWGFVGSVVLILLYSTFLFYGLQVARHARDEYGKYIATGLTILIIAQAFFNIMALVELAPLSGMPLVFISKGGTSLVTSLLIVAILLNISRVSYTNRKSALPVI